MKWFRFQRNEMILRPFFDSMNLEDRRREVQNFVSKYGREISNTLRDMRDENKVYAFIGKTSNGRVTSYANRVENDLLVNTSLKGVQFCLDQMRSLEGDSVRERVVVGLEFDDKDIFSVIVSLKSC